MRCVAAGDTLKVSKQSAYLTAKTLVGYASAAGVWLSYHFDKFPALYLPPSLSTKPRLHPFLAETIAQRRNWKEPQQKKEPFTSPMFQVLHHDVVSLSHDPSHLLDKLLAIFDWTRLGVFTGLRLGEYGQSKPRKGELFATVPNSHDAGIWANTPLAFIRSDFTFFDANWCAMDSGNLHLLQHSALEVHVHFCFDKSALNFSICKFKRTLSNFVCAVKASISIFQQAHCLCIPELQPIGVFPTMTAGDYKFIRGDDVSNIMRYACKIAYPDPRHYMRMHIDRIMAHSNRITACLALNQAGVSDSAGRSPQCSSIYVRATPRPETSHRRLLLVLLSLLNVLLTHALFDLHPLCALAYVLLLLQL
jgi:hypothetical protein